jgi:thioredoxin-like negative regulator of GroEL
LGNGDYKNAELALKNAYELDPTYTTARLTYAAAALYNHDTATADTLLAGVPISTIADSQDITQALYAAKQYVRLIALAQYKITQSPTAQNHVSLAAAYLYSGDKPHAIAELQTAIMLEPNFKAQGESYIKQIQAGKIPQ